MYVLYWNGYAIVKARDHMARSNINQRKKFLSGTQEVLYQKEFKKADRVYKQLTQKGNRS